ncbi:KH domain-containing protein [Patescibacteria group bacterium]|nr:KH domain-containing protein [Patescibacteria group bacterium]
MEIEKALKEILEGLLIKIEAPFDNVKIEKDSKSDMDMYHINIDTEDPSMLIGFHGENIHALQHLLKVLAWRIIQEDFNILLDVDNYRKRQEDNVIGLAQKKVDMVRQTKKTQVLPPMSAYFRRVIHLYLTKPEFGDVKTESIGDGDHRQITIVYNSNS